MSYITHLSSYVGRKTRAAFADQNPFALRLSRGVILIVILIVAAACDPVPPTLTPTRFVVGPTLAASPTVHILTSEELYGTSVAFGGAGQNNSLSAPVPDRGDLPPIVRATAVGDGPSRVVISLQDATTVEADLYSSSGVLRGPGLLLIGPEGSLWGDLPVQAHAAGITVIVLSLRVAPADTDVRDLLGSLSALPTVDPSRVGLIAQGDITDTLFAQCATEPMCDFAGLIGPRSRDTLLGVFNAYLPRPVLLITGETDAASTTAGVALASAAPQETTLLISRPRLADDLLQSDPDLVTQIVGWLQARLEAVPVVLPTIERQ